MGGHVSGHFEVLYRKGAPLARLASLSVLKPEDYDMVAGGVPLSEVFSPCDILDAYYHDFRVAYGAAPRQIRRYDIIMLCPRGRRRPGTLAMLVVDPGAADHHLLYRGCVVQQRPSSPLKLLPAKLGWRPRMAKDIKKQ